MDIIITILNILDMAQERHIQHIQKGQDRGILCPDPDRMYYFMSIIFRVLA